MEATQTMTALPFDLLGAFFAGQFILAAVGVFIGFKLLEINWGLGFTGSIALGLSILAGQWYVGDIIWDPGLGVTQLLETVLVSLAGAILGIMLVLTLFEPDTGHDESTDDHRFSDHSPPSTDEDVDLPGGLGED